MLLIWLGLAGLLVTLKTGPNLFATEQQTAAEHQLPVLLPDCRASPLNWRDNSQRINPNADLL